MTECNDGEMRGRDERVWVNNPGWEAHKNGTQLLIWEDFKTNHYTCKCFGDGDIWGGAVFMGEGSLCGGG